MEELQRVLQELKYLSWPSAVGDVSLPGRMMERDSVKLLGGDWNMFNSFTRKY